MYGNKNNNIIEMATVKITLPSTYTQEIWERCKVEEHKKFIGKQYVSWSQVESYNDDKGFNTGFEGDLEYILKYFSRIEFPDVGWGDFGDDVEAYVTEKKSAENFSVEEKKTLDRIKPLGVFQKEICLYIEELDVVILGYIDDMTPPSEEKLVKLVRDYKTKSKSSKKDLHLDKKHQLEIYTMYLLQQGYNVEQAEYCIIERLGGAECMRGGGRQSLKVGKEIWYETYERATDPKRLVQTKKLLISTVKSISELYKTYNKYFAA